MWTSTPLHGQADWNVSSARIADNTMLLTARGWCAAKDAIGRCEVFGADRHGMVQPQPVEVKHIGGLAHSAFLGTPSACGGFSPATSVFDYEGRRWSLAELVEEGCATKRRFETFTELPGPGTWETVAGIVWPALSLCAASQTDEQVAVKCLDSGGEGLGALDTVMVGKHRYCVVSRQALSELEEGSAPEFVARLAGIWAKRVDEKVRIHIERAFMHVVPLLISALRRLGRGYELSYDSLQHTGFVFVTEAVASPLPVTRGLCACFDVGGDPSEFRLGWEAPGWNPIASGFVIAAS